MTNSRAAVVSLAGSFILAACAARAPSEAEVAELIDTYVQGTVEALASKPRATTTAAPTETPLPSSTPTATVTLTPTPLPAEVSVSLDTNCRTGPGLNYPRVTVLEPGQVAQVTARSTVEGYWYIANPGEGDEFCWLWGEYATVTGDASGLPVLTPEAPPAPLFDFVLYRHSFTECGTTRVSLIVINNSRTTYNSAQIHVEDLTTSTDLFGPKTRPHPFGDNPSSCPKDKGSESLLPGTTAYIVVPISPFEAGNDAVAHIGLCTGDLGGGNCVTKEAYFRLPAD